MPEIRFKNCITLRDFYKTYLENNPKNTMFYCTYEDYKLICKALVKNLKDYILYDAGIVTLPHKMGRLAVTKRKRSLKRLPIDWELSRQEGRKIVNFNDHSNGYRYKAYWNKKACMVPGRMYYSFFFVRKVNRELAKIIKEKKTDYFQFL